MADQLDIIAKRISALDERILKRNYESNGSEEFGKSDSNGAIVQTLIEASSSLTSITSSHEKIINFMKYLDQLNLVLDPDYENSFFSTQEKTALLLFHHDRFLHILKLLTQFEANQSILNDDIAEATKCQPNLSKIINDQILLKTAAETQTNLLNQLILKYNSFMENLTQYFHFIDKKLTDMEVESEAKPKE